MSWESKEYKTPESAAAALKALGFRIRTEEEDNSYIESQTADAVKRNTREIYDGFDERIKKLSNIEKNANEKTSDYFARAFEGTNKKLKTLEADNEKLKKDAGKGNEAVSQVQSQLETFKESKKKEIEELQSKINEFENNQFKNRIATEQQNAIAKMRAKFKKMDDKVLEHTINSVINEFNSEVKPLDQNGVIVYNGKDGKPLISSQDGSMLTTEKILEDKFSFLIDEGRQQQGAGAGKSGDPPPKPGEGDSDNKFKLQLPDTVKSRSGLISYLEKEKKIERGTDFDRYYAENVQQDWPLRDN